MHRHLAATVFFYLAISCVQGRAVVGSPGPEAAFDHTHARLTALLEATVGNGLVYYPGLEAREEELDAYLAQLAGATGEPKWSRSERLAFWINAYNALTLKAILDNDPRKGEAKGELPAASIRRIDGVWDELRWKAAGREVTLNEIEHEILRGELREPRIHFAIVCASIGCPRLTREAYSAARIEEQLDRAASGFVNDPARVRIDAAGKEVEISRIFEWFHGDFAGYEDESLPLRKVKDEYRGVMGFLYRYLQGEQEKAVIAGGDFEMGFLDYDWSLNERKSPP